MNVLFTPYGGGSIAHIVRSLAIADTLKERGHEILFTSPSSKKKFIEQAGYTVFGQGHPEVNLNDENDQTVGYFKEHRSDFIAWLKDEEAAAREFKPDVIVNSPTFFGPMAALKLGIPHISIVNAQWIDEFHGLFGLSFSENNLQHRISRRIGQPILASRFNAVYMKEIAEFYRALDMPKIPIVRKELHARYPIIIPGIPEFEPIKPSKRNDIHYSGPLFWNGFEKSEFKPNTLWSDFSKKPFVYVSLGGSIFRKQSYIDLVKELEKRKEWNILLTLGPNISKQEIGKYSSHLMVEPYAPGLKVCEYADVVINTGGHGTVMQALWAGRPVIALPHNIDQSTIANRLVELGIGKNMNPITLRGFTNREEYFKKAAELPWKKVMDVTAEVLADNKIKTRAAAFKEKIRKYPDAPVKTVQLIEQYGKAEGILER